ncbi:Rab family GTPase [Candidatus Hodarchaeum mangrovi]
MEPHIGQYYKITIIGDGAVGKTSIIEYLLGREFHSTYLLTIGANIATYPYTSASGQLFRYQFWDLAGQRRFDLVRGPFYKGSRACIMVFDVTRPLSMENLKLWREELHTNAGPEVPFIVLGNKCDLPAVYNKELLQEFLDSNPNIPFEIPYLPTSARMGTNVHEAVEILSQTILKARMKRSQLNIE